MGIIDRIKRYKYFRYDLFVNTGDAWKQFGEGFKVYLDYKDIESPDPGSILRFYGVYKDLSQKDGWARKLLWEKEVPMPSGSKTAIVAKKEKSIEDQLMEKVVEHADFTHLQPSKLSIPFGKSGASLELQATPGGSDNPYGEIPPISFEGNLPAWLHPAAGALIVNLMEKGGKFLRRNISGAISDATGITAKDSGGTAEEGKIEAPDVVAELDSILEEAEEKEEAEKKVEKKVEKKKVK